MMVMDDRRAVWRFLSHESCAKLAIEPRLQSYDDIVDHSCYAWNTLIVQPWKIMSIGLREWAYIGRSI